MWETADYFLLHDLRTEIHDYLLDQIPATLAFLHSNKFLKSGSIQTRNQIRQQVGVFVGDLSRAVQTVSRFRNARTIQKLFAVFVCGLREHLPTTVLRDLMKINQFSVDISNTLIALHFTQATKGVVAKTLAESYTSSKKAQCKCSACGTQAAESLSQALTMVLDPFSSATRRWCANCAHTSIKSQLKTVMENMTW